MSKIGNAAGSVSNRESVMVFHGSDPKVRVGFTKPSRAQRKARNRAKAKRK